MPKGRVDINVLTIGRGVNINFDVERSRKNARKKTRERGSKRARIHARTSRLAFEMGFEYSRLHVYRTRIYV